MGEQEYTEPNFLSCFRYTLEGFRFSAVHSPIWKRMTVPQIYFPEFYIVMFIAENDSVNALRKRMLPVT